MSGVALDREQAPWVLRFGRGDAINPLGIALQRDLIRVAQDLALEEPLPPPVIVTAMGQSFSAGLDLKDPGVSGFGSDPLAQTLPRAALGAELTRAWASVPAPTVAAIEGHCLGGGVALAVACDFRVAAEDAVFATPEIARGVAMDWGSLARLIALVGLPVTRDLVLRQRRVSATEALEIGLIDALAPTQSSLDAALAFCEPMVALPSAPLAMAKRAIDRAAHHALEGPLALDTDQFVASAREAFGPRAEEN
ncbi:MAG: enoyl-CoA hydratase/isomerase family protein [Pseudomonadota bacterium]